MADLLLSLAEKPLVKKTVSVLGLPIPLPQMLDRAAGPLEEKPLQGKHALLGGSQGLAKALTDAGAVLGEAEAIHALVFDARDISGIDALVSLYQFFHNHIRKLAANGRVLVLATVPESDAPTEAAAASAAITGFIKSCAKEIGKKGATANALYVRAGADHLVEGPVRYFLSNRSAFVDGQTLTVSDGAPPTTRWTRPLDGKVALVTGAARGIGEATARRLADEGAKVIVVDVPGAKHEAEKLAANVGGVALALDITVPEAPAKILDAARELGGLHIVVNNAGVTRDKTLANMSEDQWRVALNVNLEAALAVTEAAMPGLGEGGRVIFLSSIAGIAGNFGQTNYGAAKAGLIGAVRHLAPRFAKLGATVNAVAPGFIETQMTAAIPFVTREAGRRLSNLGQGGLPVDVAEAITFLATPGAGGINGQVLRVCGGNYLGA